MNGKERRVTLTLTFDSADESVEDLRRSLPWDSMGWPSLIVPQLRRRTMFNLVAAPFACGVNTNKLLRDIYIYSGRLF